jgi:hypothetical protein
MRTARLGAYSGDPGSIGAGQSEAKAKGRAKGGVQKRLPWVTILLYPTASEREECMLAMLFWAFAALAGNFPLLGIELVFQGFMFLSPCFVYMASGRS